VLEKKSATQRIAELEKQVTEFNSHIQKLTEERDQYKKLYLEMMELCRKLERGILAGQKREKLPGGEQLTLGLLSLLLGNETPQPPEIEKVKAHERAKPTGRKPLPESLPRVYIEVIPPEVQQKGTEAFEKIGEDVTETLERRPASLVVVCTSKGKYVPKDRDRKDETTVLQSPTPELPIVRGLAGPGLLADTVVKRWQDHLPLYRLEKIFSREGIDLARSTICGWHGELAQLCRPLVDAMWADALLAPYLCVDATGVLVQALEKCRSAHFFVVAAPDKHVLFGYAPKHDSAAVDELLLNYHGYLVADAHTVYDHLYQKGDATECGCWAHNRRYYFKSLSSDPARARAALTFIKALFQIERDCANAPPLARYQVRQEKSKPIVTDFFSWCDAQSLLVLDETPISKAIGYSRNQREALKRFLEDGRLPMHNNFSERQLRREAVGRKNWLFLGNDEGGETNATLVSLLASCQLHDLEPLGYLRDLFCLLPSWSNHRVLELAPAYWRQTLALEDTQRRLGTNIYRQASLGGPVSTRIVL
jgi:transposase